MATPCAFEIYKYPIELKPRILNLKYIIYQASNTVNGKSYVGVTSRTLRRRIYEHYWVANKRPKTRFHNALNKYSKDSWIWIILEEGYLPKDLLLDREKFFIALNESSKTGYNMTEGGEDFSSSDYQRDLQLRRVKAGTHPFLGGKIQSISSKKRWDNKTSSLYGLNQKRIAQNTHNLVGNNNPQRIRKQRGIKHHNQNKPWLNTKSAVEVWLIADQLYEWFQKHRGKKRGGGPYTMQKDFDLAHSLQKIYYSYFIKGWIPEQDPDWISWKASRIYGCLILYPCFFN